MSERKHSFLLSNTICQKALVCNTRSFMLVQIFEVLSTHFWYRLGKEHINYKAVKKALLRLLLEGCPGCKANSFRDLPAVPQAAWPASVFRMLRPERTGAL